MTAPLRTALTAAQRGPERRSSDPLAVLSRHLNQDCLHALQPQELAAILEAEGYTDALIQERYGDPSVFACAERLFQLVPYRPPTLARAAAPTLRPGSLGRDLLRGVIYLLPAVWSPAVLALGWNGSQSVGGDASQSTSLSSIQGAGLGLLISSFFGWGWMQSVAYLGYLGLATSPAETARMLRWAGAGAVALTGVLAAAVALWLGQDPVQVGVVALSIACYLAAATTLLVLSSEILLVISLLPALTWTGLQAAFSGGVVPDNAPQQAAAVLALAVGLPVVAALYSSQPALIGAMQAAAARARGVSLAASSARRLGWAAFQRALPHAGYGWLCAGFLSLALLHPFTPSAQIGAADAAGMLGLSWSLAPLVLSMGVLELSVRRIHAALKQQAGTTGTVRSIVRSSAWQVLKVCFQYTALLFFAYVLARLLAPEFGFQRPSWLLVLGHLHVAAALLLSGLLINFGALHRVLGAWALALAAQVALLLAHVDVVGSYALSAGGVLALLLALMWLALMDIRNLG
ncbi:hypothetical protein E7T06_01340 [Deinococcus sp. Arct2-2]|uniref:hypothetical protein n=1 Tax=Deinococcus sp. Arct2-2 TaxID=2568653 RepID=UPI0010A5464C|nr:hypothetical protein [Deinococcus sp. Arct2-2]THF71627.1 hypothetical protein E7T06_01340 [Deinococcus sp. Arct2-2]